MKRTCSQKYLQEKESCRQEAIDYQLYASENNLSYGELTEITSYFKKVGKRYGLLREFRENAVI